MNIRLTPHLEALVREWIAAGSYSSAGEVVYEAMRLLELEDRLPSLKLQRLHREIREGLDSGPAKTFEPSNIKRRARKKIRAKRTR
jgi:antitoxin ParD1/3/4